MNEAGFWVLFIGALVFFGIRGLHRGVTDTLDGISKEIKTSKKRKQDHEDQKWQDLVDAINRRPRKPPPPDEFTDLPIR